jgi:MoaA/NifB/PqqE/SkfB family radical SAM enzyme
MRRRLHVKVSLGCNNNCQFCLDDRPLRTDVNRAEVAALLAQNAHLGEVLFTCGEPTLHPELPLYVAMARTAGYRSIGLVTNGRRLAYEPYCAGLLAAGLTEVTVSVHGHTPRLHDGLTRAPGALRQTLAGLDNLARLRVEGRPRIITSTVVCRTNADHLRAIFDRLAAADVMVVNVIEPRGEARAKLAVLLPSYSELGRQLAVALYGAPWRERVAVEGLPLCLCGDFLDRVGIREEIHLQQGSELAVLPPDRDHLKPPVCDGCSLSFRCPGIFADYASERGTGELCSIPSGDPK